MTSVISKGKNNQQRKGFKLLTIEYINTFL